MSEGEYILAKTVFEVIPVVAPLFTVFIAAIITVFVISLAYCAIDQIRRMKE